MSMAGGFRLVDFPVTVKPWGKEILIERNCEYAFKEIVMKAGTRSSLQSHNFKRETMLVLEGEIELETVSDGGGSRKEVFRDGDAYTIPPKVIHRVTVIRDSRLFEVSTPQLEDVVRHADDYGRQD